MVHPLEMSQVDFNLEVSFSSSPIILCKSLARRLSIEDSHFCPYFRQMNTSNCFNTWDLRFHSSPSCMTVMKPRVLLQLFQGHHLPPSLWRHWCSLLHWIHTFQEELHSSFLQGILWDQTGWLVVDVSLAQYQGIQSACLMAWAW